MEDEEFTEGDGSSLARSEYSRPSTPKWWRPNYPPETYEWEEMRRKRRRGGYPWTHLDKKNEPPPPPSRPPKLTGDFMDRRFVFCGCQYPAQRNTDRGGGCPWEWNLPTPNNSRRKRNKQLYPLSQSNPQLIRPPSVQNTSTLNMEAINKRYSDNIYETVDPLLDYSSRLMMDEDALETLSLDRHNFHIPPEIDIVTSEGLDGLDQPDSHDLGMDGEKEWRLFKSPTEERLTTAPGYPNKSHFTAGIRRPVDMPKIGEASNMRPLKQREASPLPPSSFPEHQDSFEDRIEISSEEEDEMEEELPKVQIKEDTSSKSKGFGKFSFPAVHPPKFKPSWGGMNILKRKKKEAVEEIQPVTPIEEPTPRQVPIHFDESMDLSLRSENLAVGIVKIPRPVPIPIQEEPDESKSDEIELQDLRELAKVERERAREEVKKLKLVQKQERKEAEEEAKRIKAEEKAIKDREKAEEKAIKEREKAEKAIKDKERADEKAMKDKEKAEERAIKDREKAEEKVIKDREKAEEKATKDREKAEEKAIKDREKAEEKALRDREKIEEKTLKDKEKAEEKRLRDEEKLQRDRDAEELRQQQKDAAELQRFEQERLHQLQMEENRLIRLQKEEEQALELQKQKDMALDELEAKIMSQVLQESPPDVKDVQPNVQARKSFRVDLLKRKLGDMNFKNRLKRRSKTPPPVPTKESHLPRIIASGPPQNQLAVQYRREISERMREMEDEEDDQPRPSSSSAKQTQILISPPSINSEDDIETHVEWIPPGMDPQAPPPDDFEEEDESKETRPKLGQKLKRFKQHSKRVAQNTSEKMKLIGKDMKNIPGIMKVKYQESLKDMLAQEELRRKIQQEKLESAPPTSPEDERPAPKLKMFRFKRRLKKQDDEVEELPEVTHQKPIVLDVEKKAIIQYENMGFEPPVSRLSRAEIIGRRDRESESPVECRDLSVERQRSHSRGSSGWESQHEDSFASSSAHHPLSSSPSRRQSDEHRRPGVLEEIDSDEFFLRQHGISEDEEDQEEVNRFLRQELRIAFRPTKIDNALRGFDSPVPPPRRSANTSYKKPKPKRLQQKEYPFQTFPPERPKRKQIAPYISSYIDKENLNPVNESPPEVALLQLTPEIIPTQDEGKYEFISSTRPAPLRPTRSKRIKKGKATFPLNEDSKWIEDLEDQILDEPQNQLPQINRPEVDIVPPGIHEVLLGIEEVLSGMDQVPSVPLRSSRSRLKESMESFPRDENEDLEKIPFADDEGTSLIPRTATPDLNEDEFEDEEDEDDNGYAAIHIRPVTVPRHRKRGNSAGKKSSLNRRSREFSSGTGNVMETFSLPRFTPRTFHIVPPTRPIRAYTPLRPKRPPRRKQLDAKEKKMSTSPPPPLPPSNPEPPILSEERPSGFIMKGRPLPPPPRPPRPHLNNLDQDLVERLLDARHYVNIENDDDDDGWEVRSRRSVVEELCVARNIPLLGEEDEEISMNVIGIQTDPLGEDDFDYNLIPSGDDEEDDEQRFNNQSDRFIFLEEEEPEVECSELVVEVSEPCIERTPIDERNVPTAEPSCTTEIVFPSRLHLEELEVDFLRVNELSAQTLTMESIRTPQLQVDSLCTRSELLVPLIRASTLSTENLNLEHPEPSDGQFPSVQPPSFLHLRSPIPSDLERGQLSFPDPPVETIPPLSPRRQVRYEDEDDVFDLGVRLARSLIRSGVRAIEALKQYLDSITSVNDPDDQKSKAQLQLMLCILLILIIGILLLTRSSSTYHHWDFYLPPSAL